MKICKKCGNNCEDNMFHVSPSFKDGLSPWCKKCKQDYDTEYRKSKKVVDYQNSQEYRDRKKEYRAFIADHTPEVTMYNCAKHRSKKNNLPFNIEISDIIIPEVCPILNIPLISKHNGEYGGAPNSPSLDRIIPNLGYVKGNIMVISLKANMMKNNANINELRLFCKNILKIINNKLKE